MIKCVAFFSLDFLFCFCFICVYMFGFFFALFVVYDSNDNFCKVENLLFSLKGIEASPSYF